VRPGLAAFVDLLEWRSTTETVRPRTRARRYINSRNGITTFDDPFVETKELLGGYGSLTQWS